MFRRLFNSRSFLRITEVLDRRSENRMTEFGMLAQAFEFAKINGVRGDYFEFGVWRGKTFRCAHLMNHLYGLNDLMLWAFDSLHGQSPLLDERANIWTEGHS